MFRGFITALLIISLFSGIVTDVALAENDVVKIGILANRSFEHCLEKWTPTADYLTRVIQGKKFIIELVDFEQVYAVVEKGDVDFILSNPSFYVKLEAWYGVSRIATLKNKVLDGIYTQFGGVVFSKKQREDIRQYSDLKGKTFMAVEETSFGGWHGGNSKRPESTRLRTLPHLALAEPTMQSFTPLEMGKWMREPCGPIHLSTCRLKAR